MILHDGNPDAPNQDPVTPSSEESLESLANRIVVHEPPPSLPPPPVNPLPEDLRISWNWIHLLIFVCSVIGGLFAINIGVLIYLIALSGGRSVTQEQVMKMLQDRPALEIGANLGLFAFAFLFLYVSVAILPGAPFWRSLGWRKLVPNNSKLPSSPWVYLLTGCGLSVLVGLLLSHVETKDNLPIEQLMKNPVGAMLLMGMAVFVAPLVEETVFRGYLYPLVAKTFGIVPGVLATGTIFGLIHGWQLAWTWSIVAALIGVGIIFTYARARTGTVFASFLLHLGYNATLAIAETISTRGFTHMPPGH